MEKKLLEVKDLSVQFPGKYETVQAVDGVSFDIYEGETFGLVGESGCGKSQTMRSILGLLKAPGRVSGGEILYKGQDITKMNQRELRKVRGREISIIFQEPMTSLNPVLKIKTQIYEAFEGAFITEKDKDGKEVKRKMTKAEKHRAALELLKLVGIPSPETRLEEYPHQFSGGMRQRAMIAIALGARPKLLLADEPTTALDVTIQDQIMKLLNRLKDELGMSIILVTHDLGVIAQMCDRVAVMYAGQIVEMTDTVTLFAHPRHPYTYGLMGSLPNEDTAGGTLEAIGGAPPNLANLPEGCPFAPRCKYACDVCHEKRPDIVEVEPGHFARCHRLDVTSEFQGLISPEAAAKAKEQEVEPNE
ncbi:MAG: ABC transporter ATP-binding protein [Oscillospiraceae bacterium]|nr:ABC transporter ATP-binding protein [Oscillospiraceae bacterium]